MNPIRYFGLCLLAMMMVAMLATPSHSQVSFGVSVRSGPPALPVYEQPVIPGEGYIWTPGYWAYGEDDYYWVPGTWVLAPEVGLLWTPPWWGWGGDGFLFHEGYWGPRVGFYGGICYGFGYCGEGYEGGRWRDGRFFYNRAVNNINITEIHNVYNETVINRPVTRVAYNGGEGGIVARATPEQEATEHERHIAPVATQVEHVQAARSNPELKASMNQGKPPIAATPRPGALQGRDVMPAKEAGAPYKAPAEKQPGNRGNNASEQKPDGDRQNNANNGNQPEAGNPARSGVMNHPNDMPAQEKPAPPNTGDPKRDQKMMHQMESLSAKQDQERQKLQQRQDQEHQNMAQHNADEAAKQQMEQRHQQQTQQMQQRQEQQRQKMERKEQPPKRDEPGTPKG